MKSGTSGDANRLQVLDLLRFLASLSVVIYHMTNRPTFLGVEAVDR